MLRGDQFGRLRQTLVFVGKDDEVFELLLRLCALLDVIEGDGDDSGVVLREIFVTCFELN